jgi:hypothetical protein
MMNDIYGIKISLFIDSQRLIIEIIDQTDFVI